MEILFRTLVIIKSGSLNNENQCNIIFNFVIGLMEIFREKMEKNKANNLILVDFCGTLVDVSTASMFIRKIVEKNKLRLFFFNSTRKLSSIANKHKLLSFFLNHKSIYSITTIGIKKKTIDSISKEFYKQLLSSNIRHKVIEKILSLKLEESVVLITSAGYQEYIQPFKQFICADYILASKILILFGYSTGITFNNNFRKSKVKSLLKLLGGDLSSKYDSVIVVTDSLDDVDLIKLSSETIFVGSMDDYTYLRENLKIKIEYL